MIDEYEDYDENNLDQSLFKRELTTVFCSNGRQTQSWVYVLNQSSDQYKKIPEGDYLNSHF